MLGKRQRMTINPIEGVAESGTEPNRRGAHPASSIPRILWRLPFERDLIEPVVVRGVIRLLRVLEQDLELQSRPNACKLIL